MRNGISSVSFLQTFDKTGQAVIIENYFFGKIPRDNRDRPEKTE